MKKRKSLKKMNVAVIGVGKMGKHHARNYFELPEARLVAVCDLNPVTGKAIAEQFKCAYYKNYAEMLKHERIDALSIAVPTTDHFKVAKNIFGKVKGVLLEKPITATIKQAKILMTLAKKSKTFLTIGHVERFNPAVTKAKQIIASGALGRIMSILAKRVGPSAPQIKNSNVLIDLAVHDIDILNYLLDSQPTSVDANGGKAIHPNIFDYSEIFLKYGNISGYIQVNWITPVIIRELHVTGTDGYMKVNYITQEIDIYRSQYKKEFTNHGDFIVRYGSPKKRIIPVQYSEPLKTELRTFLARTKNHGKPEVTPEEGYRALQIALLAQQKIHGNS